MHQITIAEFAVAITTGGATIAMQAKNRYLGILTRYQGTVQNILTPSPAKIETLLCKLCYLDIVGTDQQPQQLTLWYAKQKMT